VTTKFVYLPLLSSTTQLNMGAVFPCNFRIRYVAPWPFSARTPDTRTLYVTAEVARSACSTLGNEKYNRELTLEPYGWFRGCKL